MIKYIQLFEVGTGNELLVSKKNEFSEEGKKEREVMERKGKGKEEKEGRMKKEEKGKVPLDVITDKKGLLWACLRNICHSSIFHKFLWLSKRIYFFLCRVSNLSVVTFVVQF